MNTITPHEALKRMRELTEASVPFSIKFISCNTSKQTSKGLITAENIFLRKSLKGSGKSRTLIGYITSSNEYKWFNLPLLREFNGIKIGWNI